MAARAVAEGCFAVVGPAVAGRSELALYVARTPGAARDLARVENAVRGANGSATYAAAMHERLGELLGYPPCCVAAHVERSAFEAAFHLSGRQDYLAAADAASRTSVFHARLNGFLPGGRAKLVSFYPCRYDCEASLALADGVYAALQAAAPDDAGVLRAALVTRVAVSLDGAVQLGPAAAPDRAAVLPFERF